MTFTAIITVLDRPLLLIYLISLSSAEEWHCVGGVGGVGGWCPRSVTVDDEQIGRYRWDEGG